MKRQIDGSDLRTSAHAILSSAESVGEWETLRAVGRAAYACSKPGSEITILSGFAMEARDNGDIRTVEAMNHALVALGLARVPFHGMSNKPTSPSPSSDERTTIDVMRNSHVLPSVDEARAMGRAVYLRLGPGVEESFFEAMLEEARSGGRHVELVSTFAKAAGFETPAPSAEKGPRNEDAAKDGPKGGEHRLPGSSTVWRSATRKTYGGAPLRRGERVLIWPKGRTDKGQADEPVVAICAGIGHDEGIPAFRSLEVLSHQDDFYFDLAFVDTIDELRPGTWTRLPW